MLDPAEKMTQRGISQHALVEAVDCCPDRRFSADALIDRCSAYGFTHCVFPSGIPAAYPLK
jgi:hypothetical protein